MDVEIRNPRYNSHGTIDCDIKHPEFGWMPYTPDPDSASGKAIMVELAKVDVATIPKYEGSKEANIIEASIERSWRDGELKRADAIINTMEDSGDSEGPKPWRQYRVALRDWPASEFFPNPDKRPVSPE